VWLPGQMVQLGSARGGAVPDAEKWIHTVRVPEFEIDAQPVSWAKFAEFVDDGGYDDRRWWTDAGWAMLEASVRRAPRYVEQMAGGVLARRQGRLQRLPLAQAVLHISAFEASAWCHWAGRRLPSEAEWTLAAVAASARGFVWGEVLEWMADPAAPYPGAQDGPAALDALPAAGSDGAGWRVLRGASAWGSPRLRHVQARRYAAPGRDEWFVGFRSCAL
jgi:iron(II)-dependent oxidoreductase